MPSTPATTLRSPELPKLNSSSASTRGAAAGLAPKTTRVPASTGKTIFLVDDHLQCVGGRSKLKPVEVDVRGEPRLDPLEVGVRSFRIGHPLGDPHPIQRRYADRALRPTFETAAFHASDLAWAVGASWRPEVPWGHLVDAFRCSAPVTCVVVQLVIWREPSVELERPTVDGPLVTHLVDEHLAAANRNDRIGVAKASERFPVAVLHVGWHRINRRVPSHEVASGINGSAGEPMSLRARTVGPARGEPQTIERE